MIASSSRTFSRVTRAWQFANSYLVLSSTGHLQCFQEYHRFYYSSNIGGRSVCKDVKCSMGWNRKRKIVTPVWRPVSTQSSAKEECFEGDVAAGAENIASSEQIEESHIVSVARAIADSSISSSLQAEDEAGGESKEIATGSISTGPNDGGKNVENILGGGAAASALQDNCAGDTETIPMVSKEKHAISVEVGASVMRFIKGKDGSTQRSIEEDMGVKIRFPSSKKDDSFVIEGDYLDAITQASEKIQAIINEAVKSPSLDYSHFISLPLAIYPELVDKLLRFQTIILGDNDPNDVAGSSDSISSEEDEDVTKFEKVPDVAVQLKVDDDQDKIKVTLDVPLVSYATKASKSRTVSDLGIDKSIFIKPKTFHLTILMLKLWNKERVHAAIEVLQRISPKVLEVLDNRPLFLRLKGLDLMRGSKAKAHVLYAPIEEIGNEGRLLRVCQVITDAYVEAGLVLEKDIGQKLKLHATLMNTSHRKIRHRKGKRRSMPFDATNIFEQFGSEHWGDYHIKEAHLSQRFLYDENGYYHCCGLIPFPDNPSTS